MLSVYARHYPPCTHTDIHYRRCRCPKWIRGVLGHERLRFSARTRRWATAELRAREREREAEESVVQARAVTVENAVRAYLAEQRVCRLAPATLAQSRAFLEGRFLAWCRDCGLVCLQQLLAPQIREFRNHWDVGSNTAARRYERLRAFFTFCLSNGWLQNNPMNTLKKPIVRQPVPTDYFNRQEFQRILDATRRYEYGGGADCHDRAVRLRALVLLMRWSGLAIRDAVTLERNSLDKGGALFLRRAKTGVPVFVPLPPVVVSCLRNLPSVNPRYFFWSGNGDPRSAVQGYERSFRKLFGIVNLKNLDGTPKQGHAHMFRDTFAVELLLAGLPIDQVSTLLGHRSIKMTEKHYLPWVKARQRQLTAAVRRSWFPEVRGASL